MTNKDRLLLGGLTTKDESGRHFTQTYSREWLDRMEADGYITIHRPIHEPTGIAYDEQYWSVEVNPKVADGS